ncbi:hypothetical protein ACHQM5_001833 [Ranunculus cassubicifolius]
MATENTTPKLYSTKPKKSKLKKSIPIPVATPVNSAIYPPPPRPPPPPSPPPLQDFARRFKFVWPVLLTVNLAIGGYLFLRTNKKTKIEEDGEVAATAR